MSTSFITPADFNAFKKHFESLKRNYDRYDKCKWHDPQKRDEYIRLACWLRDLRLGLAAEDLLYAAEQVIACWEHGDLAEAVRNLAAVIATARGEIA
jgi:hypothetical protein